MPGARNDVNEGVNWLKKIEEDDSSGTGGSVFLLPLAKRLETGKKREMIAAEREKSLGAINVQDDQSAATKWEAQKEVKTRFISAAKKYNYQKTCELKGKVFISRINWSS